PAEYFDRYHAQARRRKPDWVYDIARVVLTPLCILFYRCRALGAENVPSNGPVILAPNHFSQWDHFFAALYIPRKVRFMAKSQLSTNTVVSWWLRHRGAFPIRRGDRDEEAFKTVDAILDGGGCMLMYPEGGRSRSGRLGDPKPGIGRIALQSGVPVIP